MKKIHLLLMAVPCAVFALPSVKDVQLMQSRPGIARIAYTLVGEPAVITVDVLTNGHSVGGQYLTNMTGHVNVKVQPGTYTNVWYAGKTMPELRMTGVTAVVTAWPTNDPPPYLVADLREEGNEGVRYYASEECLPGGVDDARYKLDRLLMRKCPVAGRKWFMGSKVSETSRRADEVPHYVTFSQDYYIGVYKITQGQYTNVFDEFYSPMAFTNMHESAFRPMNYLSYGMVRGSATDNSSTSINWPKTGEKVGATSTLGRFRDRTGLYRLDLPTEAQWEVACRAGTMSAYNNGSDKVSEATVSAIAWCGFNLENINITISQGSKVYSLRPLQPVGNMPSNDWGLFDMHGNGSEFCRDWYAEYSEGSPEIAFGATAVDPVGPEKDDYTTAKRVIRNEGPNLQSSTGYRSAKRSSGKQGEARGWYNTFRFVTPAVAE